MQKGPKIRLGMKSTIVTTTARSRRGMLARCILFLLPDLSGIANRETQSTLTESISLTGQTYVFRHQQSRWQWVMIAWDRSVSQHTNSGHFHSNRSFIIQICIVVVYTSKQCAGNAKAVISDTMAPITLLFDNLRTFIMCRQKTADLPHNVARLFSLDQSGILDLFLAYNTRCVA